MKEVLALRLAAMSGFALAAAAALWWLGSTRLALDDGSDASRSAAHALLALWLVRGVTLALLGLRGGALRGWRSGTGEALGLIAPSWPLVVLACSASTAAWAHVALAECGLLAAGVVLPLAGQGLRRVLRRVELAEATATAAGAALAASVWIMSGHWTLPSS